MYECLARLLFYELFPPSISPNMLLKPGNIAGSNPEAAPHQRKSIQPNNMQRTKNIMRDTLKRALYVRKPQNQDKNTSVVPALVNEKQFKTAKKIQCASDSWGEIMKTQTLGTRAAVPHQILSYLKRLTTAIFHIKISDQIKLRCTWKLVTMVPTQGVFLLRSYTLLGKEIMEDRVSTPFSSIEQCPYSFSPSMVERCEVRLANKRWTTVQDPTTIGCLLEEVADILHHLGGTENPKSACEAKRQVFCQRHEEDVTGNTKLQQILNEGGLEQFNMRFTPSKWEKLELLGFTLSDLNSVYPKI